MAASLGEIRKKPASIAFCFTVELSANVLIAVVTKKISVLASLLFSLVNFGSKIAFSIVPMPIDKKKYSKDQIEKIINVAFIFSLFLSCAASYLALNKAGFSVSLKDFSIVACSGFLLSQALALALYTFKLVPQDLIKDIEKS